MFSKEIFEEFKKEINYDDISKEYLAELLQFKIAEIEVLKKEPDHNKTMVDVIFNYIKDCPNCQKKLKEYWDNMEIADLPTGDWD